MERCDEVKAMWDAYLETLPPDSQTPEIYMTWHFGSRREAANELGRLTQEGIKTATASLFWEYEVNEEEAPQPGDVSIITDYDGAPLCIIQTAEVEIKPFDQVDARQAYEEGEGDRSLAFWREVHWRVFSEACEVIGRTPAPDMPVVCERFSVVYRPAGSRQI